MPELNVNIGPFEVFVPAARVLRKDTEDIMGMLPAVLFSATSVPGKALYFQVLFEDGAMYERLTVEDIFHDKKVSFIPLESLQWWDCPSPFVTFTEYSFIQSAPVSCHLARIKTWVKGRYVGTFDWHSSTVSDGAGGLGHKAAHFCALESGGFALVPNNGLRVEAPSFTTKLFDTANPPRYTRNRFSYSVEGVTYACGE